MTREKMIKIYLKYVNKKVLAGMLYDTITKCEVEKKELKKEVEYWKNIFNERVQMKILKSNKSFTYKQKENSDWFDVVKDNKIISSVIDESTARQVIHQESKSDNYLNDEDFENA